MIRLVLVGTSHHHAPVELREQVALNREAAQELAARLSEDLYYEMEAPVLRVTGYDTPYPPSRLEEEYLPDLDRVLHTVDRSLRF